MDKTIELVREWASYEATHPEGDIEAFCRHYLAHKTKGKPVPEGVLVGGVIPMFTDGLLMKIIGRLGKICVSYTNMALKDTELNQIEEFGILVTIMQEKNPKKIEVINANLFEISSGTDILTRLKKRGLIEETDDEEDKRSKRLWLTPKGAKAIRDSIRQIKRNAQMVMISLTEEDKLLCIQILKNLEIKLSALWPQHRGKAFDDVYESLVSEENWIT